MLTRRLSILAVTALVLMLAGLVVYAVAQPPAAPGGFQGGGANAGARGGGGPGGQGMRGMMGMRMMGTPAIAVTDDAVFVVRGNTIFKFDAETLELLAQADMPMPKMPERPAGGAAAPGQ